MGSKQCVCQNICPFRPRKVCGSDGKTYLTLCALKSESCKWRKPLVVLYKGNCGILIWFLFVLIIFCYNIYSTTLSCFFVYIYTCFVPKKNRHISNNHLISILCRHKLISDIHERFQMKL